VVGQGPERGVFLDAEHPTPCQQAGDVGWFDPAALQGLAVGGDPGFRAAGVVGGQDAVGDRAAAGIGVAGEPDPVEQPAQRLRDLPVFLKGNGEFAGQLVPEELLHAAQADDLQALPPGQRPERGLRLVRGDRVGGRQVGQRGVDRLVPGVEGCGVGHVRTDPQHCLYFRAEPHQHRWFRAGGQAISVGSPRWASAAA